MTTVPAGSAPAKPTWRDHLRLTGALAAKDIGDALRTKSTLVTLIISLLMVLFYRSFPMLVSDGDTLNVLLYAETESAVVAALERSPALAVYRYASPQQLLAVFTGADDVELAVIVPPINDSETAVTIDGYLMYWVSPAQRANIKAQVEADLSAELGRPVRLNIDGHDVYFDADTSFFTFSATIALLFITVMIGISLVPNLMVEEKQMRTLDVLRVSPAAAGHLVAGKAIAGLFYGLVGCTVVLLVFGYLIIQWPLAVLAAVLGTLFMVAVGLLLGSVVNGRAQLQLVAWFVIIPLLIPVILVALEGLVPAGAVAVMNWIPTVLVGRLFLLSLTPNAALSHYGIAVLVVVAATLLLLALVIWIVRRQDRG